jgi:asparagine synthase (glutamine-hydrolysing)
MCGIVATVGGEHPLAGRLIEELRDCLAHRGPDDAGLFVEDGVGLGHRRLAIIDLSPAGRQPIANEDGSQLLVFNGEIYNYVELRDELRAKGRVFRTQTDSEVLLHLYSERGEECIGALRGMFAFAIWDRSRRQLFAGRDRLGKKPIYYAVVAGALVLASEIKALLRHPKISREPDAQALQEYLALQYVPSPLTAFRDVRCLPPAHTLLWRDGRLDVRRYWQPDFSGKPVTDERDAERELDETLDEAVRIRLRSDVPVGVLLSGGLDSSLVAALAAAHVPRLKTFTVGFQEGRFDERAHARRVADYLGTEHHEIVATETLAELLPRLVRQYDQPFADPAALPTLALSEATRRHVTVALNGDGGDETFAGYARYRGAPHWRAFQRLPRAFRDGWLWQAGSKVTAAIHPGTGGALRRFWELGSETLEAHYLRSMSRFSSEALSELVTPEFRDLAGNQDAWRALRHAFAQARARRLGSLNALLAVDLETYLPDCLLVKVDIASMAFGLEVRSPLLDHRVVDLAARLPESLKLRGEESKYLLRRLARRRVPNDVIHRPKSGFGVPIGEWMRTNLRETVQDLLLDGRLARRGQLRPAAVEQLVRDHLVFRIDRAAQLWSLVVLEMWQREVAEATA